MSLNRRPETLFDASVCAVEAGLRFRDQQEILRVSLRRRSGRHLTMLSIGSCGRGNGRSLSDAEQSRKEPPARL